MEMFKFFDAYSVRARLFPAIIAAAPALAALTLLISWKTFGLSNVIASLGILVLLFAIADFSRARGRAVEAKLYEEHKGMPSITMFRRNLLGVKALALLLNAFVVAVCVLILWRITWDSDTPLGSKTTVVLVVAAAHAAYMLLAVTRNAVWDASRAYGRELIISCESFPTQSKSPARKKAAPKSVSKTENTSPPPGQP